MKRSLLFIFLAFFISITSIKAIDPDDNKKKFSFAFLSDIHLNKGDNNCFEGLEMAISSVKAHHADFIITGGDNVDIDVLGKDAGTAHWLYGRYAEVISNSNINFYPTIGNHDRFYGCPKSDLLYEKGLFEDFTAYEQYCKDISEEIAGERIDNMIDLVEEEDLPDVLEMSLNAILNGVYHRLK